MTENIFKFGKYKNRKIKDICIEDNTYITWCIKNVQGFYLNKEETQEYEDNYTEPYQRTNTRSYNNISDYDRSEGMDYWGAYRDY